MLCMYTFGNRASVFCFTEIGVIITTTGGFPHHSTLSVPGWSPHTSAERNTDPLLHSVRLPCKVHGYHVSHSFSLIPRREVHTRVSHTHHAVDNDKASHRNITSTRSLTVVRATQVVFTYRIHFDSTVWVTNKGPNVSTTHAPHKSSRWASVLKFPRT